MNIRIYSGKHVAIVNQENRLHTRFICEYFYSDENKSGIESIFMNDFNGAAVEYFPDDIKEITVMEDN